MHAFYVVSYQRSNGERRYAPADGGDEWTVEHAQARWWTSRDAARRFRDRQLFTCEVVEVTVADALNPWGNDKTA